MQKNRKKVILGLSAGVDSSMAAVLLKERGYDVVGIFMRFWKDKTSCRNKNCYTKAQQDAKKLAQILNIPFFIIDVSKKFKKEVVDYFLDEIKSGKTPNPCVVCNEKIKFNILFKKMLEMKADYVATGHYARIKNKKSKYYLHTSFDNEKDQTYFLYSLTQNQLSKILFPIGDYNKIEVKKMIKKAGIVISDKNESQNLCFTSEKSPENFIRRNLNLSSGDIVLTDGQKIGEHNGLELYTIGQRKGINIGGTGPYYVAKKDLKNSCLIVTNNKNDENIYKDNMQVEVKNWIIKEPKLPAKINVKIRYRHPLVRGIINKQKTKNKKQSGNIYEVIFDKQQKAVTPGQSAVFYVDNGEVLGGGIII
jgi:tRNA-specific 2-thiouridylase